MTIVSVDRAWFKKNPDSNLRVRRAGDGEVERIMKKTLPSAGYEMVCPGGVALVPTEDAKWCIAVIRIDAEHILKMLVLRPEDWAEDTVQIGFESLVAFCGSRVFIERVAA